MNALRHLHKFRQLPGEAAETLVGSPWHVSILRREPPSDRVAVIFVHGFGGDSYGTWRDFHGLSIKDQRLRQADLYFYSYRSSSGQLPGQASRFELFASTIADGVEHHAAFGGGSGGYRRIVLVAHSQGAVIARLAVLQAHKQNRRWVESTRLVLFAPAHCGERIASTVASLLDRLPLLGVVIDVVQYRAPATEQLTAGPGTMLEGLRRSTERLATEKPELSRGLRATCVFGDRERVVVADVFDCDVRWQPDPLGHDHQSICKPNRGWMFPVQFVDEVGDMP